MTKPARKELCRHRSFLAVLCALWVLLTGAAHAAHVWVEGMDDIAFRISISTDGRLVISPEAQEGRLYYETSVADGTCQVLIEITDGDVPSGTSLTLTAEDIPSGCGTLVGSVVLNDWGPQPIITGIPSPCETAEGIPLSYGLAIADVNALRAVGDGYLVVRFTIAPE
ncbi:MAG: hypothetical protein ACOYEP_08990 [Limnochordia bacterium]|jgi:hypothetical protein